MFSKMLQEAVYPLGEALGAFPTNIMPQFLSDLFGVTIDPARARKLAPIFLAGLRDGLSYQDPAYNTDMKVMGAGTPGKMVKADVDLDGDSFEISYPSVIIYRGTTKLDLYFIARQLAKATKRLLSDVDDVEARVRQNLAATLIKYRQKVLPALSRELSAVIKNAVDLDATWDDVVEFADFGDLEYVGHLKNVTGEVQSASANVLPKLISGRHGKTLPVDTNIVLKVIWNPNETEWEVKGGYDDRSGPEWGYQEPTSYYSPRLGRVVEK